MEVKRDTLRACFIGQVLSFLLAITGTTSGVLASSGINAPTTQSFFNYCLLAVTCSIIHWWCTTQHHHSHPNNGTAQPLQTACGNTKFRLSEYIPFKLSNKWYIYLILAILDVEGNFLVTKAYQYTSVTSVTLLDCTTIPAVMILSLIVFRSSYLPGHIIGALLCTAGLGVLVLTDSSSETGGRNPVLGDLLVIAGAAVYAVCNIVQEKLLSDKTSRWELLAMIGVFGSLISGVQAVALERDAWQGAAWNMQTMGAMIGFALSLYLFYVLVPSVLILGSSTVLNLSLLTSDLWAVGSRVVFFGGFGGTAWAFAIALSAEAVGLVLYAWSGETHRHADKQQLERPWSTLNRMSDIEAEDFISTERFHKGEAYHAEQQESTALLSNVAISSSEPDDNASSK
ncbi:hypothetical protein CEUSTIGMA_g3152.t1 [Chlamydomonas eustigma]|uniref:EamA domain-containing protein n=1 Tax=Chlamydomonas eustigma TaxID=1157962 RepID=A0A250WYD7_9CHLO|nr:hypothetical protein CEUSTIGMA_g3152.t1 [Chlamydomonas eustigma]|eukprot:GAX75709.1 hypothetical protein CEUSTIGMA_g3152.t1 [Chlamydomonas eustigma]